MITKKILIFSLVIFLIIGVFATSSLGTPKDSIKEKYSKGEKIQGWINISFEDEPATSVFSDSFGNSISLINLLKTSANSKVNYTCEPANCQLSYDKTSPATQKQISFSAGEEKLIGFVLSDNIDEITNFSLTIISDAVKSDKNQLKIDLFNDGTKDIGNTKSYTQTDEWSAPRNYSCFNPFTPQIFEGGIKSGDTFCQRIKLPEAPGFSLGAWLKKETSLDSLNLEMNLYDIELEEDVALCNLPEATTQETPVYCDINYLITKQKDYYVCLSAESGTGTYKMQSYGYIDKCGFRGSPGDEEIATYKIFTQPKYFDAIGTLKIFNKLPSGEETSYLIEEYIDNKYDNLSCAGRECIIPIKLISNVQQALTISGEIEYDSPYSSGLKEKNIYTLSENSAKITAGKQKVFLDNANFTTPKDIGEHEFILYLENTELFKEKIEIKKGIEILSMHPQTTASGLPTNFKVRLNTNNITIAKYKWDFNNDGIIDETTLTNTIKHTYNSTGNYNLIISVEDSGGASSSESFNVVVGSAKEVLDELILEKQEKLSDIQGEILNYDLFSGSAIENILNLSGIEKNLNDINSEYLLIKDSGTEQKFQILLSKLLEIELPKSISKTLDSAPLTFFPQKENIDLSIIETIAGGNSAGLEDEYSDAILTWNLNALKTKVSVKEYSANYGFGEEMLVKIFKIDIKNLGAQETPYLFIGKDLQFLENKSFEEGYYSETLTGNKIIELYTTEDIEIEELPAFISPSLDELNVDISAGAEPEKAGKPFNWIIFSLIILGVIFLAWIIYILLNKWYKEKYESHLFKNKNDLYNMVTYVHKAKQHEKKNDEISRELRKSGWSSEQINYVMKKYSGKNIGMPGRATLIFANFVFILF